MEKPVWRLLIDQDSPGDYNMAVDESILNHCLKLKRPTFRFYKWDPACLSLGYFQKVNEINLSKCKNRGIDVVRRPTGGRAVLHKNELTYSVIIPLEFLPGKLIETYKILSEALTEGLKKVGLNAVLSPVQKKLNAESAACFDAASSYEIKINGQKVIGSAQTRKGQALLQHGSIPIFNYNQELVELLELPSDRGEKLYKILEKKASTLSEEGLKINRETYLEDLIPLEDAIIKGFSETIGWDFEKGELTSEEREMVQNLSSEKYRKLEWKNEGRNSSATL